MLAFIAVKLLRPTTVNAVTSHTNDLAVTTYNISWFLNPCLYSILSSWSKLGATNVPPSPPLKMNGFLSRFPTIYSFRNSFNKMVRGYTEPLNSISLLSNTGVIMAANFTMSEFSWLVATSSKTSRWCRVRSRCYWMRADNIMMSSSFSTLIWGRTSQWPPKHNWKQTLLRLRSNSSAIVSKSITPGYAVVVALDRGQLAQCIRSHCSKLQNHRGMKPSLLSKQMWHHRNPHGRKLCVQ